MSDGEPIDPSPTIDQAVSGGFPWLEIQCARCKTQLLWIEPDGGTTNIRNMKSKHWARWLGVENCCVVPFNSFSEFNKAEGADIWFALDETRPSPASPVSGRTGRPSGR